MMVRMDSGNHPLLWPNYSGEWIILICPEDFKSKYFQSQMNIWRNWINIDSFDENPSDWNPLAWSSKPSWEFLFDRRMSPSSHQYSQRLQALARSIRCLCCPVLLLFRSSDASGWGKPESRASRSSPASPGILSCGLCRRPSPPVQRTTSLRRTVSERWWLRGTNKDRNVY